MSARPLECGGTAAAFKAAAPLPHSKILLGTWHNTNPRGRVMRLEVGEDGTLHAEWGVVPIHLYADSLGSHEAMAFSARFELPDLDVRVQANVKGGVLVVAYFTRFLDASGRSPYFRREFYWRDAVKGTP